jgi:hypothetical protein
MSLKDREVVLEVDDEGAVYPVTIDPYAVVSSSSLLPFVGPADPKYGWSAAVSGDVAVVGEPDEPRTATLAAGAVSVFRRGPTKAWTAERTIRIPIADGTGAEFGHAVDVWVYTAASDGQLTVTLTPVAGELVLYARSECGDFATDLGCDLTTISFSVEAGEDYFIFVDTALYPAPEGGYTLSLSFAP